MHKTQFEKSHCSSKSEDVDKIVTDLTPQRSDSEPGVDTGGIYVENHSNRNREFFIWMQLDHGKLDFRWVLPRCVARGPPDF